MTPAGRVVGIDLGGTRLRAATAPAGDGAGEGPGSISASIDALSPPVAGPAPRSLDEFRAAVVSIVKTCAPGAVTALGLTVPGLVEGTTCRWVPNLAYLDGVDLGDLFADLDLPASGVVVGNDAHLALLAEATAGSAVEVDDAVLLAVGTGIGSAVLTGGRIVRGAAGGACSFGWACADLDDRGDERLGWLERQASGVAIDRIGAAMTPSLDAAGVVAAARAGDPAALDVMNTVAGTLGATVAGAVALLDPAVVVLAGGVADAFDVLRAPLRAALERQLPSHLRAVEVVRGRFGPMAGLVGAVVAARRGAAWAEVVR